MIVDDTDVIEHDEEAETAGDDKGNTPAGDESSEEQVEAADDVASDPDEVVVSFGDDEPSDEDEAAAPEWVKNLRRDNRELRRQLAERQRDEKPKIEIGPRPRLEEFDYDEDAHAEAVEAWAKKKSDVEADERASTKQAEAAQAEWQKQLQTYAERRSELKVPDFKDAEDEAAARLTDVQQAIIVKGAENPAAVIYALGKHPQRLATLAATGDPVKFAFAVAKLERDLRVTPKRKAPPPEGTVRGAGAGATTTSTARQKQIDELYAKMSRGGDVSAIRARIRELEARG